MTIFVEQPLAKPVGLLNILVIKVIKTAQPSAVSRDVINIESLDG